MSNPGPDSPEHLAQILAASAANEGHLHVCLTCPGADTILVALHHLAWNQGENPYAEHARTMLGEFAANLDLTSE